MYSMKEFYIEYAGDMIDEDKMEALRDGGSQLTSMLADDFGVIPDLGDSCTNLLKDITANDLQEGGDSFVD